MSHSHHTEPKLVLKHKANSISVGLSVLGVAALSIVRADAATAPAPLPSRPEPAKSVVEAARSEIERREEMLAQAQLDLEKGRKGMGSRDYESALNAYNRALSRLPDSPRTAKWHAEAVDGFRDASLELARVRIAEGRYSIAEQVLDALLKREPQCKAALKIKEQLNIPGYYNKTVTPIFRADVEQVKQWLLEGQGFYDSGRYDLAIKRADQILSKDPYNIAARKLQERANKATSDYGIESYNEARSRALSRVDRTWANAPRNFAGVSNAAPTPQKIENNQDEKIRQKLSSIRIPEVVYSDQTIREVAEDLTRKSKEYDKSGDEKKGVTIIPPPEGDGFDAEASQQNARPATANTSVTSLQAPVPAPATPFAGRGEGASRGISLPKMENQTLSEILSIVAGQKGLKISIDNGVVSLLPAGASKDKLITRSWSVTPYFFVQDGPPVTADLSSGASGGLGGLLGVGGGGAAKTGPGAGGSQPRPRTKAKDYLVTAGINFDFPGATAIYNKRSQILTVTNTPEMIIQVDELVKNGDSEPPLQVEIQAKFVEFSQTNQKELSFDWLLGQANVPGSHRLFVGGGLTGTKASSDASSAYPFTNPFTKTPVGVYPLTSGNRSGNSAISSNAIDGLLNRVAGSGTGPAALSLAGIGDPEFQILIRALSQQKGVDLLSSPSITTKTDQKATIQIVRELIYPTAFSTPQIPTSAGAAGGAAGGAATTTAVRGSFPVAPASPTTWNTRPVGVTMDVTPTINSDSYSVELDLAPEVTEFEGFIDYGSPIQAIGYEDSTGPLGLLGATTSKPVTQTLTENHINQPVFSVRKLTTNVSVLDGRTVTLGGLIREDVQKVNDKIPGLGDLPLVGRLFRSSVEQRVKKNLTIFVTVRIIDASGQPLNSREPLDDALPVASAPSLSEPTVPGASGAPGGGGTTGASVLPLIP